VFEGDWIVLKLTRRGALFTDILYKPHGQQERKASHGLCGRADSSISLDDRPVSAIVRNAGGTVDEALARDWFPSLKRLVPESLTLPAVDHLPYESRSSCIAPLVLEWMILFHHDDVPYICRSAKGIPLCPSSDWSEVPGAANPFGRNRAGDDDGRSTNIIPHMATGGQHQ
jgi:hypothetical protein